jgi:hypothetical protein
LARQILRVAGLIVCLGVSVFSSEISAQSPVPHPDAPGSILHTINVATDSFILDLDGPWRFHSGRTFEMLARATG